MELEGNPIPLEAEVTVVGRSRDCDLRVDDPAASRRHFELHRREDGLYLDDLGSSNGTYRNGRRVQDEERLEDGDVLLVGETEMTIRALGAVSTAADERSHATVQIPIVPHAAPPSDETPPHGLPVAEMEETAATEPEPESTAAASAIPGEAAGDTPAEPPRPPSSSPAGGAPSSDPGSSPDAAAASVLPGTGEAELGEPPPPPPPTAPAPEPPVRHPTRTGARPAFLPPAGFWVRLGAVVVDAVAIGLVSFLIALPFGGSAELVVFTLLTWLLSVAVPVVGWARWGTTPGKKLFGLVICTTDGDVGVGWGQAAIRWVGYLLSGLLLGVGFLMVGFTASKRGLHDHLAGTYVGKT